MHPIFADIAIELAQIEREAAMVAGAAALYRSDDGMRAEPLRRWIAVNAIGSGLEKVYSGAERILKMIAATVDGGVPNDESWHRTLLQRMAVPLPGVRPAVLRAGTLGALDALRSFRHRERNSYVADLDPDRVLIVADGLGAALAGLESDLEAFRTAMDSDGPP